MRLRIDCAYDGTNFHGWAKQPFLRTVQGTLEQAIQRVCRWREEDGECRLTVAGRTDAGVHARRQVCHIDIDETILERTVGHLTLDPIKALEHRLQHVLEDDVCVHSVSKAPEGFDARFSALERTYVYRIADDLGVIHPALRYMVHNIRGVLDVDLMNEAATMMIGLHDFGSFALCNEGGTTIREVKSAQWLRLEDKNHSNHLLDESILQFTITADAFARSMVRSLVHGCVQVGLHKRSLDWFKSALLHVNRTGDTGPIAANGLTLEEVVYPEDYLLADRAEKIRAKRTL